jgi:hypothetical protein
MTMWVATLWERALPAKGRQRLPRRIPESSDRENKKGLWHPAGSFAPFRLQGKLPQARSHKQPVYSVVKAGSSTIMPMLSAPGPIFTAPVRPMLLVSSSTLWRLAASARRSKPGIWRMRLSSPA